MIQELKDRLDSRQRQQQVLLDRIGRALYAKKEARYNRLQHQFGRLVARSSKDTEKFLHLVGIRYGVSLTPPSEAQVR